MKSVLVVDRRRSDYEIRPQSSSSATATLEATTGARAHRAVSRTRLQHDDSLAEGEGIVSARSSVVIVRGKSSDCGPHGLCALAATGGNEEQAGRVSTVARASANRSCARATVSAHELGGAVPASPRKPRSDDVARAIYRRRVRRNGKRRPRRMAVMLSALLVVGAGSDGRGRRDRRQPRSRSLRPRRSPPRRNRPEHVRVRRRRDVVGLDPSRAKPPTRAARRHQPLDAAGDDRRRGPALLPAQRCGLRGHRTCAVARPHRGGDRRGRLDADPAARAQPLHLPRAHRDPQVAGGLPRRSAQSRLVEAADPPRLAEHRLLR